MLNHIGANITIPRNEKLFLDRSELKRSNACTLAKIFLNLVQQLLRVWLNLLHEDVQVKQISTAMTNMVYEVTSSIQTYSMGYEDSEAASMEPEKLLLRVYGPSTWMFEREKEERIVYGLMSSGISPPWLGVFGNGRIEEFIPSSTVSAQQFRSTEAAEAILAEVHRLHSSLDQVIQLAALPREDALWERLELWNIKAVEAFRILQENIDSADFRHYEMIQTISSWDVFSGIALEKLKDHASKCHSPLIFGHCDLHHGNVLLKLSTKAYVIIDYEYAMITSRGFDLANYFWEHCTDYDSLTPEIPNTSLFPEHERLLGLLSSYEKHCGSEEGCNLEGIAREVHCYLPIVHLHWGLWGIIKAAEGPSKFDYLQYAVERLSRVFQSNQILSSEC